MRLGADIARGIRSISPLRLLEFLLAALVMALLTLIIGDLPELEVIESTVNDDSFSDLVITTRGELPIDTSIMVVTYGPEILDQEQRVDRGLLAEGLAILLSYEPAIVGVDFMIDDTRESDPEGDQMLAGVIADNREKLIFGIYSIDSLGRALPLPPMFEGTRTGAVNLMPGEDRTIRTFTRTWPGVAERPVDLLSVAVAEEIDPQSVAWLRSFDNEEFVIDYAAGLGEHSFAGEEQGLQVFPSIPLSAVVESIYSEGTADDDAIRSLISGRAILVGYADLRSGQVNSLVDRFWTPLKPEKNALPDMHGVAIHANILNTILQRRIVTEVPAWVNVLWGTLIVFLMYVGFAALARVRPPQLRTMLRYLGWGLLLLVALTLPIFLFRSTPYKLSVYTPFAGLVLGRLVLSVYDRAKRIVVDTGHRRAIRKTPEGAVTTELQEVMAQRDPRERYVALLHVVQKHFHIAADRLFAEAAQGEYAFRPETVGSPTPRRLLDDVERISREAFSRSAQESISFVERLWGSHPTQRALRAARSLVIAVNEIDRQNTLLDEGEEVGGVDETRDTVIMAVSRETTADAFEESDRLLRDFLKILAESPPAQRDSRGSIPYPFAVEVRCVVHDRPETFIYLSEQEDANNRDDFHDLIYAGDTIRCRPESHPGLTDFRRLGRTAVLTDSLQEPPTGRH